MQGVDSNLQRLLTGSVFFAQYSTIAFAVQASARSDRLSPQGGLDWEVYYGLLASACFWLLAQALIRVFRAEPKASFSVTAFFEASLSACFPYLSDAFDTLKDFLLGGLCLTQRTRVMDFLVYGSMAYLLCIHMWFLFIDDICDEMTSTYVGVLKVCVELSAPHETQNTKRKTTYVMTKR